MKLPCLRDVRLAFDWMRNERGALKQQVARGWAWLCLGEGITRVAALAKLAVLGRLLSPHAFGVVGIASLYLQWLSYFTQTGLDSALIQKRGEIREYLDTYWTVQVLRGLGLGLVLFLAAPAGAAFFNTPEAVPVIRVMAISAAVLGFRNPGVVCLGKELNFRSDAAWKTAGPIVGLLVAIPLAYLRRDVWALAVSVVASDLASCVASYFAHSYRPRLCLKLGQLRELTGYSKWVVGSRYIGFLEQNMDTIVVGKLLGADALGLYQVVAQVALLPTSQLGAQMRAVLFPAFSKIDDARRLQRAFLSSFGVLSALVVPAATCMAVFADPILRIGLGPQWLAASSVLRLLVWVGVMKGLSNIAAALLMAAGQPRFALGASVVNVVVFAVLCYPALIRFGANGAALAAIASAGSMLFYYRAPLRRLIWLRARDLVQPCRTAVAASLPFVAAVPLVEGTVSWRLLIAAACATGASLVVIAATVRSRVGRSDVTNDCPATAGRA